MIIHTVLDITKRVGFETVNAKEHRRRALQCSTRPIFTCYENMEELKGFSGFCIRILSSVCESSFSSSEQIIPHQPLHLLSYIEFAAEETHLFKLLFMNDMDFKYG